MPDSESTFNFHSGTEFWSQSSACETWDKFVKLKIARKWQFLRVKLWTLKFAHKWTKDNKKKNSSLSDVEFHHLSGVCIRFCIHVLLKRISPPQMKHVEANIRQKAPNITNKTYGKASLRISTSNLRFFKLPQHWQRTRN
jgi:hypothetical protein